VSARKHPVMHPILLRRGPLSGRVMAVYRYTREQVGNREILRAHFEGKQDVSSDFDALVLEELVDDGADDIVGILDGAADGEVLTDEECVQVRVLRERLKAMIERHNARLDEEAA
jgi:hypothetical protein